MKIFRRWTTGIVSRVDWMVSQVENQEALVNSAIREARQSAARAKVQLGRVKNDGKKLQAQVDEQSEACTLWKERARACAATDEERALECLRRSRQAENRLKQLHQRLKEHQQVERQLTRDVAQMDSKISGLVEKRNLLRTRQSRAEAMSVVHDPDGPISEELDEVFDRWETQVVEAEYKGACELEGDSFGQVFVEEEDKADLKEELKRLQESNRKENPQ